MLAIIKSSIRFYLKQKFEKYATLKSLLSNLKTHFPRYVIHYISYQRKLIWNKNLPILLNLLCEEVLNIIQFL